MTQNINRANKLKIYFWIFNTLRYSVLTNKTQKRPFCNIKVKLKIRTFTTKLYYKIRNCKEIVLLVKSLVFKVYISF